MSRFRTRFGHLPPIFIALVVCCSISASCQVASGEFSGKGRIVPAPVQPMPFAADTVVRDGSYSVRIGMFDALSPQDRLLVDNAESAITELARSAGLEYGGGGGWRYRKIDCSSFPNHLFLQFSRNQATSDRSAFTASVPRTGGKVRVIPLLKRGYSLFSPAPINAITISAFNHIREEEGSVANRDWLGNALCYAALSGAQPEISPSDAWPTAQKPVPSLGATIAIQLNNAAGREVITFDDIAARPHPMEWSMTFTRRGRLIKATHRPADMLHGRPIPKESGVAKSRQVP